MRWIVSLMMIPVGILAVGLWLAIVRADEGGDGELMPPPIEEVEVRVR